MLLEYKQYTGRDNNSNTWRDKLSLCYWNTNNILEEIIIIKLEEIIIIKLEEIIITILEEIRILILER